MVGVRTPIGRYRGIQPIELDWTRGQLLVLGNTSVISNPINTQTDWVAEIACDNPCWYTIAPAGTSAVPVAAKAGAGSQYLPPNSPRYIYVPAGWVVAVVSASGAGNFTIVPSFPGVTGTTPFLLDQLSATSTAAFSFRKLRAAYTGGAMSVRRGSDSTTATIGFTPTGDFDLTGYTAFVGVSGSGLGNGFIATWFDQSTGTNNATQATAGNQPQIILNTQNGRPCARGNGTSVSMATTGGANLANPETLLLTARLNLAPGAYANFVEYSTTQTVDQSSAIGAGDVNWWFGGSNLDGAVYDSTVSFDTNTHNFIKIANGTTLTFYLDSGGASTGGGAITGFSGGNTHIGLFAQSADVSPANFLQGDLFEFVAFQAAFTAGQVSVGYSNPKAYFRTP